MKFCDLRRFLLGGYRREDVPTCYQKLIKQHVLEEERLRRELDAKDAVIRELSSENEALHLRNRHLEEWAECHEKTTQCL